jgi:hypothetical protein
VGRTTVNVTATDACGNSSTCSFTVTVVDSQLPVITGQPEGWNGCVGGSVTYTVVASNVVTYTWQRFSGGSWTNIVNSNAPSLTVNQLTLSMNRDSFRVVLQGNCSQVISKAALLLVNPLPTVTVAAAPITSILPGQTTTLTATATPSGGSYVWFVNNTRLIGYGGFQVVGINVDQVGNYKVTYTDNNGCSVTSNPDITITPEASPKLWVYPSPNNGKFQIRYYNDSNEPTTILIHSTLGQIMYKKVLVATNAYSILDVNLNTVPNGVYIVTVVRANGTQLESKRIVINH